MLDKENFDEIFGEGAYDAAYAPQPTTVKVIFTEDKIKIERGDEVIEGPIDNILLLDLLAMMTYHASDRMAESFDDDLGEYKVEILKIDFNSIAKQADERWL